MWVLGAVLAEPQRIHGDGFSGYGLFPTIDFPVASHIGWVAQWNILKSRFDLKTKSDSWRIWWFHSPSHPFGYSFYYSISRYPIYHYVEVIPLYVYMYAWLYKLYIYICIYIYYMLILPIWYHFFHSFPIQSYHDFDWFHWGCGGCSSAPGEGADHLSGTGAMDLLG